MRRLLVTAVIAGSVTVLAAPPASANTGCQTFQGEMRQVCFTVLGPLQPVITLLCEDLSVCFG